MDLILNDLSMNYKCSNIQEARDLMYNLVMVCREAIEKGIERKLRTKRSILNKEIASNYLVVKWLNDPKVNRDIKRYFKSLATKSPYIDSDVENDLYNKMLCKEFKFEGENARGLGVAYLMDTLSISFNSDIRWDDSTIKAQMEFFDPEEDDVKRKEVKVKHASQISHVDNHLSWIENKVKAGIKNGQDLWNRRNNLFSSLAFCERVKNQLMTYKSNNSPFFQQIIKRLFELDNYFNSWNGGRLDKSLVPCKVTRESKETLNKYKEEHKFTCPDGNKKIFSWHVRMTPGDGRIYFICDSQSKKGLIGHIGRKLKTVLYPK